jgi:hypothetical protein
VPVRCDLDPTLDLPLDPDQSDVAIAWLSSGSFVDPSVDGLLTLLLTPEHAKSLGKSAFVNTVNTCRGERGVQIAIELRIFSKIRMYNVATILH